MLLEVRTRMRHNHFDLISARRRNLDLLVVETQICSSRNSDLIAVANLIGFFAVGRHRRTKTAALAQKNSQATRALAAQEDILEKELSEIQKVLLAMQDQQQKQLELILAIAETGKLLNSKRRPSQEKDATGTRNSAEKGVKQMEIPLIQASALQKEANKEMA